MGDKTLTPILYIVVAIILLGAIYQKFSDRLKISDKLKFNLKPPPEEPSLKQIGWMVKNPEIFRRLAFNLFTIIVVNLISMISFKNIFFRSSNVPYLLGETGIFGDQFLSFLSGVNFFSIFSLWISPFIGACIFLQILSFFIPPLRRLMFREGTESKRKLTLLSYSLTLILCLLLSFNQTRNLIAVFNPKGNLWIIQITMIITLTGAVFLLLWMAKLVERYGLGNGIQLLVFSRLLWKMIFGGRDLWDTKAQFGSLVGFLLVLLLSTFLFYLLFSLTRITTPLKLQSKGRDSINIPIRLTLLGREPFSWAVFVILIPLTLAVLFDLPSLQHFGLSISSGKFYLILMPFLVFLFAYIYAQIVYRPPFLKDLIDRYGFKLEDSEKKQELSILKPPFLFFLFKLSILFTALTVIRSILLKWIQLPISSVDLFFGLELLIFAGVLYDWLKQAEFIRQRQERKDEKLQMVESCLDELETSLKAGFLKQNGIPALVEPIRFSWGIPIRTIIDNYRIYVPEERATESFELLKNGKVA